MNLDDWIGRSETVTDTVTPTPYAALSATLDRDPQRPPAGTPLPALWHWLYFLPLHRQSEIGPDGHAKRGGFLPPGPAAAPHVGRQPVRVPHAAAHRRRADAHIDDSRRHGKKRQDGAARIRQGPPRNPSRRRSGRGAHRIPRHRVSRSAERGPASRPRPPPRPRARRGSANGSPTTCCSSATRR